MSERELQDLFAAAVASPPAGHDVIARAETRGRVVRRRRRVMTGVGGLGLVAAATAVFLAIGPVGTFSAEPLPLANSSTPSPSPTATRDAAQVRQQALLAVKDLPTDDGLVWNVTADTPEVCGQPTLTAPGYDHRSFGGDGDGRVLQVVGTEASPGAALDRIAAWDAALRACLDPQALKANGGSLWKPLKATTVAGFPGATFYTAETTCANPEDGCGISSVQTGVASVGSEVLYLSANSNGGIPDAYGLATFKAALEKLQAAQQ